MKSAVQKPRPTGDRHLDDKRSIAGSGNVFIANRSVIGSMNQLGMFLGYKLERTADLLSLALRLSHIPMLALKGRGANTYPFPDSVTRELFGLSGRVD
jgi:hypothetical protein